MSESVGIFPSKEGRHGHRDGDSPPNGPRAFIVRGCKLFRKTGPKAASVDVEGRSEDILFECPALVDQVGDPLFFSDGNSAWSALKALFLKGLIGGGNGREISAQEVVECLEIEQGVSFWQSDRK